MNFDAPVDRRNTNSNKWDDIEAIYGVSPDDALSMWVADTDLKSPDCIQDAVRKMLDHGVYGYTDRNAKNEYHKAIAWWMETRHGWSVDPSTIFENQSNSF